MRVARLPGVRWGGDAVTRNDWWRAAWLVTALAGVAALAAIAWSLQELTLQLHASGHDVVGAIRGRPE